MINVFMKGSNKRSTLPTPAPQTRLWLVMAGLCAVTLLAYGNSFSSGFVLDNRGILLQDPRIREVTMENLKLILRHTYWWPYGESGLYRPFTTLTYLFNYAILGNADSPTAYHWINLLLHAGNALLVYALLRRLQQGFWPAAWVAGLWAVHPVLTESVTNIVGRADLLAGMAVLSGFLLYLKSTECYGRQRYAWLAGLLAVTTVGVFSKESAVVILGVIALYELTWWKERHRTRALFLGCATVALALAGMGCARAAVIGHLPPTLLPYGDNPLVDAGFWTAKLTALKIMAKYLGLLFWPAHLSCDYSYAQIPLENGSAGDWLAWLVVAGVAIAAACLYRRNRPMFFLSGVSMIAFLPTSNLLLPIGTIMAERFLYLPAIAAAAVIVCGCYGLAARANRRPWAPIVLGLLVAACIGRTWARNADWHDGPTLMKAAVATSPHSFKSHSLLAASLYEADPSHSNIDAVIAEADKGLAILEPVADWHNSPDSYSRAGGYYLTKAELLATRGAESPESRRACQRALELLLRARSIVDALAQTASRRRRGEIALQMDEVKMAHLERTISVVEMRLGDAERALEAAAAALRLDPANAQNYRQLSAAYLEAGRVDDAAATLAEGTLVTSDMGLRQALLELYRSGLDAEGCATTPGPYGPAINPSCEIVHKHLCAAYTQAVQLYERLKRGGLVEKMKGQVEQLKCR